MSGITNWQKSNVKTWCESHLCQTYVPILGVSAGRQHCPGDGHCSGGSWGRPGQQEGERSSNHSCETAAQVQMVRRNLSSPRLAGQYGIKYRVLKETYCSLAWYFHTEQLQLTTLLASLTIFFVLLSDTEFGERPNVLPAAPPSPSLLAMPTRSRVPSRLPCTPWQVGEAWRVFWWGKCCKFIPGTVFESPLWLLLKPYSFLPLLLWIKPMSSPPSTWLLSTLLVWFWAQEGKRRHYSLDPYILTQTTKLVSR